MASITRDISPPDATLDNSFIGSPTLNEIIILIVSAPLFLNALPSNGS